MTAKNQVAVGTFGNPYLYAGYYYDTETGMYYLNARYYSPRTGRFISRDAASQQATDRLALNAYAYTENNPTSKIDPSGHVWVDEETGISDFQTDLNRRAVESQQRAGNLPRVPLSNFGLDLLADQGYDGNGNYDWGVLGDPEAYAREVAVEANRQWYQDHSLGSLADNPALLPEMHSESGDVSDIAYNMLTGNTGINMQNGLRLTGSAAIAMGLGMPGSKYENGGTWEPNESYNTSKLDTNHFWINNQYPDVPEYYRRIGNDILSAGASFWSMRYGGALESPGGGNTISSFFYSLYNVFSTPPIMKDDWVPYDRNTGEQDLALCGAVGQRGSLPNSSAMIVVPNLSGYPYAYPKGTPDPISRNN